MAKAEPGDHGCLAQVRCEGSAGLAVAPECRRLTGLDPQSHAAIERHAEFAARLLVP